MLEKGLLSLNYYGMDVRFSGNDGNIECPFQLIISYNSKSLDYAFVLTASLHF